MIDINNLLTEPFIRDAKCQASEDTDLENGLQVLQSDSDFGMEDFSEQIQEAEIQVDKLSGLLINLKTLLKDANEESKSATKASEIKAIKNRMEKYINEVGKIARIVKGKLQVITIDNILFRQMPGFEKGTASDRARMNVTNVLTKKLKELLIEFETLRQTIQDEFRDVVERHVITVTGTRPDESMIDHLIETGSSEQIFQNAFEQMRQGKVIGAVEEIQERHEDAIKEIEERISELHQIYLKTAVLVEGQAKLVDNIENKVTNAVDRFESRIIAKQTRKRFEKVGENMRMYIIWMLVMFSICAFFSSQGNWCK